MAQKVLGGADGRRRRPLCFKPRKWYLFVRPEERVSQPRPHEQLDDVSCEHSAGLLRCRSQNDTLQRVYPVCERKSK